MKLNLIAAAVLALVAVAPAHADINPGSASPGNGELFLSIWDTMGTASDADDRSYSRDLGIAMNSFATGPNTGPVNVVPQPEYKGASAFVADATLATFLSSANTANLFWNVVGVESFGRDRIVTTASQSFAGTALNSGNVITSVGFVQTYLVQVNDKMPGTAVTDNLSATYVKADGGFAGDSSFGGNFGGGLAGFNNVGAIGDELAFWTLQQGQLDSDPTQQLATGNLWSLASNGTLTYAAPVPEADTYALMLAGLGLVGFLARRRKAV